MVAIESYNTEHEAGIEIRRQLRPAPRFYSMAA
jgi:hypothetical protein